MAFNAGSSRVSRVAPSSSGKIWIYRGTIQTGVVLPLDDRPAHSALQPARWAQGRRPTPAMAANWSASGPVPAAAETSAATPSPDELLQENAALKAELAALKQTLALDAEPAE